MRISTLHIATAALFAAASTLGQASSIFLARNTVVPVIVESDMTVGHARIGDRFTAHVDVNHDLPLHTRLIGRVTRVEPQQEDRKAFVELEFTDVILPDGSRHEVHGVPIFLDDKNTVRRDDGRLVLKDDAHKRESYVLGGAVGGFVLGSIIHKQRDSTLLGLLAGVVAAESDRKDDGNTVFRKGQRIGMLVNQDARFDTYGAVGRDLTSRDRRDGDEPGDSSRVDNRNGSRNEDPRGQDPRDQDPRNQDPRNQDPRSQDDRNQPDRGDPARSEHSTPIISFDRHDLHFSGDAQPYRDGDKVMIPVEAAVKQLGFSFERGKTNAVYVEGNNCSMRLEQDSTEARLNGRSMDLSCSVVERNNVIYAPVEILNSLKHGILQVDGNRIEPKAY